MPPTLSVPTARGWSVTTVSKVVTAAFARKTSALSSQRSLPAAAFAVRDVVTTSPSATSLRNAPCAPAISAMNAFSPIKVPAGRWSQVGGRDSVRSAGPQSKPELRHNGALSAAIMCVYRALRGIMTVQGLAVCLHGPNAINVVSLRRRRTSAYAVRVTSHCAHTARRRGTYASAARDRHHSLLGHYRSKDSSRTPIWRGAGYATMRLGWAIGPYTTARSIG